MIILASGIGLGDHLCLISVLQNKKQNAYILTDGTASSIYKMANIRQFNINYKWILRATRFLFKFKIFNKIQCFNYSYDSGRSNLEEKLRSKPNQSYQQIISAHIFGEGNIYQYNHSARLETPTQKFYNWQKNPYHVVQSATKISHTKYKNPSPHKIEKLIESFRNSPIVQIGSLEDPLLSGVIDMRGKTTLAELTSIVYFANEVFCVEGFIAHLASAYRKSPKVIFTGFSDPKIYAYADTEALYSFDPSKLKCAPCYLLHGCRNSEKCLGNY